MTEAHESSLQTTAPTDNETQSEVVPPELCRSSRERRPNTRFAYDKQGVPYIQSVSSQRCVINVAATETLNVPGGYNSSHAWWCNPNALCEICNNQPVLVPCKHNNNLLHFM